MAAGTTACGVVSLLNPSLPTIMRVRAGARELCPAVNRAELLAELAHRHRLALVVGDDGPELGKVELCGVKLLADLGELLLCVQRFTPPPQSVVALVGELVP